MGETDGYEIATQGVYDKSMDIAIFRSNELIEHWIDLASQRQLSLQRSDNR